MTYLKYHIHFILFFFILNLQVSGQKDGFVLKEKVDGNGDPYGYVTNDPMQTRIYTLENGMKVYISPNFEDSRIQAHIGVRAGSAFDPAESTGLAHYMEHILFKGTSKFGTVNWEEEHLLLEKIAELYEHHRATNSEKEKKAIYRQIDSLSTVASNYAAPNEFDKLCTAIGAKRVNAATSYDFTYYREDIPSNELERWAQLESERMSNLALRLFHTELETVYEEYNRAQDNDGRQILYAMFEGLFKEHPYRRPVIGNPSDLKNPSMKNIIQFFDTWYVPNNMFIVLSGRVDPEEAMPVIRKYFGPYTSKALPAMELPEEKPITQPRPVEIFSEDEEKIYIAFRFDGRNSKDYKYVTLLNRLLTNNGSTGLFDINLNQSRVVHSATSSIMFMKDYGILYLSGYPNANQSLDDVKAHIFSQIDKIKNGEFDEWLLEAIVNDFKVNRITGLESNATRAASITFSDLYGEPYEKFVSFPNELERITKKEIVSFARKNFRDNYVAVFKKKGEKELLKVDKPPITPLQLNLTNESSFARNFMAKVPEGLKLKFTDYKKEFPPYELRNGMKFYYMKEPNGFFSYRYIIPIGREHDPYLPFAIDYFKALGTSEKSHDNLKKEFFRYGIRLDLSASPEKTYININGLDENFDKSLQLVEHMFTHVENDPSVYRELIEKEEQSRRLRKNNQRSVSMYGQQYILFGAHNSMRSTPSVEELKRQDPAAMLQKVRELFDFDHIVYYSGNRPVKEVMRKVSRKHHLPAAFASVPPRVTFDYRPLDKPVVWIMDNNSAQAQVNVFVKDNVPYDPSLLACQELYSEYYGVGMGSVVFQEIREARALAYSANSYYQMEVTSDDDNTLIAFAGTQANKLPEAITAMNNLLDTMKFNPGKFEIARDLLVKAVETEWLPRKYFFGRYMGLLDKGIDYDVNKTYYNDLTSMTPEKFGKFFNSHISLPNRQYFIQGKKQDMDLEALKQFGEVKEITLEDIFGY